MAGIISNDEDMNVIARPVPTTADIGSLKNLSISLRRALRPPVSKPRCARGSGLGWGERHLHHPDRTPGQRRDEGQKDDADDADDDTNDGHFLCRGGSG